ncbi:MAG: amidohydrolase [Pseudobacteriovorax sp.]|nr:amidohydrolase [Pseudobacteriovorax sp.]
MTSIDIHTHIMPKTMPDFKRKFGYGGFIQLEHLESGEQADMKRDDGKFFRRIDKNCWDPKARIDDYARFGVSKHVLSTIPVLFSYWAEPKDGLEVSRFLNDDIANTVREYPENFYGLGTLPMQHPDLAIKELERSVKELGLCGIQVGSHIGDWNLNAPEVVAVFEACQDLGACVLIHPWDMMGKERMPDYWLPWLVGMPAETSLAICSMIFGGVFEKLPNLRVAFAHGGGSFPATIGRIEHGFKVRPDLCAVDNPINPREYLGKFYIDSILHDKTMLRHVVDLIGEDKVILGSDYPFPLGELEPGSLIRSMDDFAEDRKKKLVHDNALRWLGVTDS